MPGCKCDSFQSVTASRAASKEARFQDYLARARAALGMVAKSLPSSDPMIKSILPSLLLAIALLTSCAAERASVVSVQADGFRRVACDGSESCTDDEDRTDLWQCVGGEEVPYLVGGSDTGETLCSGQYQMACYCEGTAHKARRLSAALAKQ